MAKSLLEAPRGIVARGTEEGEHFLESLKERHRVALPTRVWALPNKDAVEQGCIRAAEWREATGPLALAEGEGWGDEVQPWMNLLTYGDNFMAMTVFHYMNQATLQTARSQE